LLLVRVQPVGVERFPPEDAQGDERQHDRRNSFDEAHPAPGGDVERLVHRQQPT
jgi:hypothetical protein